MAQAASSVSVAVKFSGVDNVSKSAQSATKAIEKFGDAAGSTSGRLSTALSSLGDFAGRSEGAFRTASEAAGAFDDVLALLPGPIGLAVGAIGGLTAVIVTQSLESQRNREALLAAYGPGIATEVGRLAGQFDLTREAQLALGEALRDSGKNADQVRLELGAVVGEAERVGNDGSRAVLDFAKSLVSGIETSDRLRNRLKALGIEVKALSIAEATRGTVLEAEGVAADKLAEEQAEKLTKTLEKQRATLKSLELGEKSNFKQVQESVTITQKLVAVFDSASVTSKRLQDATRKDEKALADQAAAIAVTEQQLRKLDEQRTVVRNTYLEAVEVEKRALEETAQRELDEAGALYESIKAKEAATKATQARAASARVEARAVAEAKRAAEEQAKIEQELAATIQARNIADQETRVLQAEARVATAKTEQEQIAAATLLAQEQLNTQLQALERERNSISGEAAQRRIDALKALNAAALAETIRGIKEREQAEQAERQKGTQKQQEQFKAALDAVSALQSQLGTFDSLVGNIIASLPAIGAGVAQGLKGSKENIEAFTSATNIAGGAILGLSDAETQRAVNIANTKQENAKAIKDEEQRTAAILAAEEEKAKAVEDGERRKAAILAVMAAAQAALALASVPPNIPGAIAAGAAAALYGSIAGGIVSTSRSGAGVASAGATTGGGAGLSTTTADQAAATAGNVNINFGAGFVIGTTQQVGKAVAGSLKSLQTTGLAMAGGV